MEKVIDYVRNKNQRLVSPIWPGRKEFNFLCMHHIDFSDALGFEIYHATPLLRLVKENSIQNEVDLKRIIEKRYFDYSFFDVEIRSLKESLKTFETPSGGGCFGPLTVASGILGIKTMMRDIVKRPQFVKDFVSYITSFMIELAERETLAGGQFFWIAEPLASLLSPKNFWDFSGVYLKKIFDAAKVPGFLHVCGSTLKHTDNMVRTGAQVLSIDYVTDIGKTIRMVPQDVVILGNIDPSTLRFGTVDDVRKECNEIMDACRGFDNFVMGTGCSIMEGTPDENMEEVFKAVKDYPFP